MTNVSRYALIELSASDLDPTAAIAVGPMSMVTEPILGSIGRAEAAEILQFTRESVGKLLGFISQFAEQKQAYQLQVFKDLDDLIGETAVRLDAFIKREAERQRQARAEARKAIEDSLPDPDNPDLPPGDYPAQSLEPSLRDPDDPEDAGAYAHYPDGPETQMPGKPAELPQDAPRGDQGHLPKELLPGAPPLVGTMPVWDIRELKHPQPDPPTQAAIGGP
jgi:hypothetical protein